MGRLILPDGREAQWQCNVCGETFELVQHHEEHVVACARRNMEEIRVAGERPGLAIFNESEWDPEVAEHLRNVAGKRMREAIDRLGVRRALAEGHLEVRPNERAGL